MKKLASLAMALVLFYAGQAMALMIEFDFDLGSTLYIEQGSSDPLTVNLNLFNDSNETADFSFHGGAFSSNGDYLRSSVGDIYANYSLEPGETETVLWYEFWAEVLDWSTFSYLPAEEGDQLNLTSMSVQGVLNGTFGSWGIAAIEPNTNIFSVMVGTELITANPVPEPTTILLFGSGLIGLAGFARRKKKVS